MFILFKRWYKRVKYDERSKSEYVMSLLRPDQIYYLFDLIIRLRERKIYWLSDYLRNRLVKVGFYWYMPNKINLGNLSGVIEDKLRISFGKENIISGHITNGLPGHTIEINLTI
jgi:hypothetical protein